MEKSRDVIHGACLIKEQNSSKVDLVFERKLAKVCCITVICIFGENLRGFSLSFPIL